MLTSNAARSGSFVLHNGKGRPDKTLLVARRNLSTHTSTRPTLSSHLPRSVVRPRRHTLLSRATGRPEARFASTATPTATAAPSLAANTSPYVDAPPPDAWTSSFGGVSGASVEVTPHLGYMKELGLDYGWGPTAIMQFVTEHIQVWGDVSLPLAILGSVALIRIGLFRLYLNASDSGARLALLKPRLDGLKAQMTAAQRSGDQANVVQKSREMKSVVSGAGVSYWAPFLPMFAQLPLGFGMFRLSSGMAKLPVPGLDSTSFLWITDLTVPDPIYLMPALTGAIMYFTMKRGSEMGGVASNTQFTKTMARILPGVSFLFTAFQPGTTQLVFAAGACFAYLQQLLFGSPAFRRWARMQPSPGRPNEIPAPPSSAYGGTVSRVNSVVEEKPGEKEKSGLVGSVKGAFNDVIDSARKTMGQDDGSAAKKRSTKRATKYEQQRKGEIDMEDLRRQARENESRARKLRK